MNRDPQDDWAEVELFRWQYGELPGHGDMRRLNRSEGIKAMAKALEDGCKSGHTANMPTPFNVCEVLYYCARKMAAL